MADRLSDKTQYTNTDNKPAKPRCRKRSHVPKDWNPNDPLQLKYDEMISKLKLPEGCTFWGYYFRWLLIPGCSKILLRVQRLARKKEQGGYETHAIMCLEGIPYQANSVDIFLELMRESEECALEEIEELEDREKSYFQWLKTKKAKEVIWLENLNLSLENTAEEISAMFITELSRQFFQNSSLKLSLLTELPT
ncbi:MAG: hypothetical protein J6M64_10020 [Oscillospiraceae bacterium]|nr:hypothetical protein [Oscillospiraceae bacterium]